MDHIHQWISVGVAVVGFVGTWLFGAFRLGRAVEQIKAGFKKQIDDEREKIIDKIEALKSEFEESQKAQDHNYGEVGAAMRQFIADVEKKVRDVELYGERHYVQKGEFEKATNRLESAIKEMGSDIKDDLRERIEDLRKLFEAKH